MIELLSQDFEGDWRYAAIKNPVAIAWFISLHQIQKLYPLAADYLSSMSSIDPRDIPQSHLPLDNSQVKQQNTLGLVNAYSFIAGQTEDQTVSLHRLRTCSSGDKNLAAKRMLEQWTVKGRLPI